MFRVPVVVYIPPCYYSKYLLIMYNFLSWHVLYIYYILYHLLHPSIQSSSIQHIQHNTAQPSTTVLSILSIPHLTRPRFTPPTCHPPVRPAAGTRHWKSTRRTFPLALTTKNPATTHARLNAGAVGDGVDGGLLCRVALGHGTTYIRGYCTTER